MIQVSKEGQGDRKKSVIKLVSSLVRCYRVSNQEIIDTSLRINLTQIYKSK